jgi:hypothetical protein
LLGATREIPDAVGDYQGETPVARWQVLHWRKNPAKSTFEVFVSRPSVCGRAHGPREIGADDLPTEPCDREGIPPGAAPDVEGACSIGAFQLAPANARRKVFAADFANPATVPGALHGEPVRGSTFETSHARCIRER